MKIVENGRILTVGEVRSFLRKEATFILQKDRAKTRRGNRRKLADPEERLREAARRIRVSAETGKRLIYVICSSNRPVKIGVAADAVRRMKELQTGHPEPLRIRFTVEVHAAHALAIEAECHARLVGQRLHGEWFRVSVAKAIETVEQVVYDIERAVERPAAFSTDQLTG